MYSQEIIELLTPKQKEIALLSNESGLSAAKAANKLGHDFSSFYKGVKNAKRKLADNGEVEGLPLMTIAEGRILGKVTTQIDGSGEVKNVWYRQDEKDVKSQAYMLAAVEELTKEIKPLPTIKKPKKASNKDILNLYTLTDVHLAMLAWDKEGGDDWDTEIAIRTVKGTFMDMLDKSPDSEECVINQGGDWQQYDSFKPVTPQSGHILDSDTRPQKMVQASINLMRWLIVECLKKHKKVNVVIQTGNHDQFSSLFLQQAMIALFEDNKRVHINDSPLPYYAFEFGKVMLGFHHGHIRRNEQLPLVFAAGFAEIWGRTKIRDVHKGHRHHFEIKEMSGMTVIEHPTIAARDSHASHGGFFSTRCAISVVYHKSGKRLGINFSEPLMID